MPDKHTDHKNTDDTQSKPDKQAEAKTYLQEQKEGVKFLRRKFSGLHKSPEADSAAKRAKTRTGESVSQKPETRIANYLHRFREILDRKDEGKRQRGIEALRRIMHRQHVIKPEDIPQGYWNNQAEIIISQGRKGELREGGVREEKYMDKKAMKELTIFFRKN